MALSKLQTMNFSVEFKRSSQADGWEFWFNVDKVDMSWCKNITTRQLTENMFIFWKQKFNSIEELLHEYVLKIVVDYIVCEKDT